VDASGGSFDVILTPSSDVIDLGNFGANLEFSNFIGLGSITVDGFSAPILPLDNIQSEPDLSTYPNSVGAGDDIYVTGIAAGTLPDIGTPGTSLVTVNFSAPLTTATQFDVALVAGDPIFSPTDITAGNGPHSVVSLGSATIGPLPHIEVELTSLHSNGMLSWTSSVTPVVCHVEWAPSLTSQWSRSWASLTNILMTNVSHSVAVPMFYRVICEIPE